jgi:hypothetical protein
LRHIVAAG